MVRAYRVAMNRGFAAEHVIKWGSGDMKKWRNEPMLPHHVELCQRVFDAAKVARDITPDSDANDPVAALVLTLYRHGVWEEDELLRRVLGALDEKS